MAKSKGVSSKTHTKEQLDDYANQHNPNSKAYKANQSNKKAQSQKPSKKQFETGETEPFEWYCYSDPFD